MPIFLALCSSACWGASDYVGGLVSKNNHYLAVTFWRSLFECCLFGVALLIFTTPFQTGFMGWGMAAGAMGSLVLPFFYKALAEGHMGTVAPIAGTVGAAVPFLFGLITGERPSVVSLIGIVIALIAIVLVSMGADQISRPAGSAAGTIGAFLKQRDVVVATICGLAFGGYFVLIQQAGDDAGVWPLFWSTFTLTVVVLVMASVRGVRLSLKRGSRALNTFGALLDAGANAFYIASTRVGLLSIVGVLSSTYPVTTVVLASVLLKERLSRLHIVGLFAALCSYVLIGVG